MKLGLFILTLYILGFLALVLTGRFAPEMPDDYDTDEFKVKNEN